MATILARTEQPVYRRFVSKATEDSDNQLAWQHVYSQILTRTSIFTLSQHTRRNPANKLRDVITIEPPDWVTVIPELPPVPGQKAPSILLVRQFRQGSVSMSLEFPAGMIEPGEDPRQAAARELLEETGYSADHLEQLSAVNPNPAFMTNTNYTFLATGLKKTASQTLDTNEFIHMEQETVPALTELMGKAPCNSAITVQAWYFYLQKTQNGDHR